MQNYFQHLNFKEPPKFQSKTLIKFIKFTNFMPQIIYLSLKINIFIKKSSKKY